MKTTSSGLTTFITERDAAVKEIRNASLAQTPDDEIPPDLCSQSGWRAFRGSFAVYRDRWAHVLGWVALIAIGVVSLTPPRLRPVSGASRVDEHLIAFFILALLMSVGRRNWHYLLRMGALLVCYSGFLELAQLSVPGRHSRLSDFITSIVGVAAGAAVAYFISPRRTQP